MFIRSEKYGEFINSADIVRLYRGVPRDSKHVPGHKIERTIAQLRDGTSVELANGKGSEEWANEMFLVTPAAPGYEALFIVEYDDTVEVIRHPVLGWRMDVYGGVNPVTLDDDTCSNVSFGGVKYPDGTVVVPGDARFANEKLWFEEAQERKARNKAA